MVDNPAHIGYAAVKAVYIAVQSVGIYVRGPFGGSDEETRHLLLPHADAIAERLDVPLGDKTEHFFVDYIKADYTDTSQRDELIDWLGAKADLYEQTLNEILGDPA